jgi:hypothetical protein
MAKLCSGCSRPAEYSLAVVLSTLGISKRMQRCSPVVLFCKGCIHALCENGIAQSFTPEFPGSNRSARDIRSRRS